VFYFDEADDTPTKIGKAIGSVIGIAIYLGVAGLMIYAVWGSFRF
jgi:hypothetical protein